MRVLIVSPFFPPQAAVAALRLRAFARDWARSGTDVTVLTTVKREDQRGLEVAAEGYEVIEVGVRAPRFLERLRALRHGTSSSIRSIEGEHATVTPGAADHSVRQGIGAALRALRRRSGIFSSVRMPDLTDWWVRPAIRRAMSEPAWDVVLSSSGPYTAHRVALALKRAGRARAWIADFRDLWTQNAAFTGVAPFSWIERRIERAVLAESDLIVTVSDGLAAALRPRARADVAVIFNGFDEEEVAAAPDAPRDSDDIRTVRLVYTGTVYPGGQDPAPLFDGWAQLAAGDADAARRLRLEVAGDQVDLWMRAAAVRHLDSAVRTHGVVRRSDALALQAGADALILLDWSDPARGVLTTKVFEYLACSAPILVIGGQATSPIAALVERARRGVHLGSDPHHIARALQLVIRHPGTQAREPDHAFIAQHSRRQQSAILLERLRSLVPTVCPDQGESFSRTAPTR